MCVMYMCECGGGAKVVYMYVHVSVYLWDVCVYLSELVSVWNVWVCVSNYVVFAQTVLYCKSSSVSTFCPRTILSSSQPAVAQW